MDNGCPVSVIRSKSSCLPILYHGVDFRGFPCTYTCTRKMVHATIITIHRYTQVQAGNEPPSPALPHLTPSDQVIAATAFLVIGSPSLSHGVM